MMTASTIPSATQSVTPQEQMIDTETLCHNLKVLLVRADTGLDYSDSKEHILQLERWMESYRRGLSAARKIGTSGIEMLNETRTSLAFALEELLRLESEGGNAANNNQRAQIHELTRAIAEIDQLIPVVRASFEIVPETAAE